MDTNIHHNLNELFTQLGLTGTPAGIRSFVARHRPLPGTLLLPDAPFWSESQARFLREQKLADGGDWAIVIDELDAMLREHPEAHALQHDTAPNAAARNARA